jgi:hypothetical protein
MNNTTEINETKELNILLDKIHNGDGLPLSENDINYLKNNLKPCEKNKPLINRVIKSNNKAFLVLEKDKNVFRVFSLESQKISIVRLR